MIFIMGDIHGAWGDADDAYDKAVEEFGKPELLIQVGDFGYYPTPPNADPYHSFQSTGLWGREFDHPVRFIDGNHENHEALRRDMPSGACEYMERGRVEDGILYVGGALSVDKHFRIVNGYSWSALEELTEEECDEILKQDIEIHTVISHTCPSEFDMEWACNPIFGGENKGEQTRVLLQKILEKFKPKEWYFGHWHQSGTGIHTHNTGEETSWRLLKICEIYPVMNS